MILISFRCLNSSFISLLRLGLPFLQSPRKIYYLQAIKSKTKQRALYDAGPFY